MTLNSFSFSHDAEEQCSVVSSTDARLDFFFLKKKQLISEDFYYPIALQMSSSIVVSKEKY